MLRVLYSSIPGSVYLSSNTVVVSVTITETYMWDVRESYHLQIVSAVYMKSMRQRPSGLETSHCRATADQVTVKQGSVKRSPSL
jgi:hypothetical protein